MNATFSMSHRRSGNPGFRATNVYRWFGMQSFGLSALACGLAPACRDTAAIFCPDSCMRHARRVGAAFLPAAIGAGDLDQQHPLILRDDICRIGRLRRMRAEAGHQPVVDLRQVTATTWNW